MAKHANISNVLGICMPYYKKDSGIRKLVFFTKITHFILIIKNLLSVHSFNINAIYKPDGEKALSKYLQSHQERERERENSKKRRQNDIKKYFKVERLHSNNP